MPVANYFVHPSSCVDEPSSIGPGTRIWHFCHVMGGARIGRDCILGQNVFVAGDVVIGNRVKIQNNVSVYDGVVLENYVFCGPSCVFTNVRNPRSEFPQGDRYARTRVRRGATIGANATVVCSTTIGRYAFIGAGAVVTKDVPDYALMLGIPAVWNGWVGRHGQRLVPEEEGLYRCPRSGWRYRADGDELRCLDGPEDEDSP